MPSSGAQGLVTSVQTVVLKLVFSEPVTGVTANSFAVSGPTFSGSPVSGVSYSEALTPFTTWPSTFLEGNGPVTVSLQVQ